MRHASPGRSTTAVLLAAAALFAFAGTVIAQSDAGARAIRDAARQQNLASGHTSPTVVVDGAPRPLASAPVPVEPPRVGRETPREHNIMSVFTVTDEPSMADDFGGDDIIVASSPDFDSRAFMVRAVSGTYFVAVIALGDLHVYRSTDAGESWTLWSTFSDPAGNIIGATSNLLLGEFTGAQRVLFAYLRSGSVYVAYADITAPVPSWTIVTAMTDATVNFINNVHCATDFAAFPDYYIYVVAEGVKDGRRHVYFSRSVDQGTSYENEYRIAESIGGSNEQYTAPKIAYGNGGYLHVIYRVQSDDVADAGISNRRAPDFANGGVLAWQGVQTLMPVETGSNALPLDVSASITSDGVYAHFLYTAPPTITVSHHSDDAGATWPATNLFAMPQQGSGIAPLPTAGGDLFYLSRRSVDSSPAGYYDEVNIYRATTSHPNTWGDDERLTLGYTTGTASCTDCLKALLTDPAFGNRLAIAWVQLDSVERRIRFDAEWRRDPSYPNTDIGFPVPVTGGGQTPPAVAQVDDDPELEIVFGTISGDIHVRNHDGTLLPGWPVNIGLMAYDGPVAIGDLVGNGEPAIVAANRVGEVFAFDRDGGLLPGWPVTMDAATLTYVSIGALGPPNPRYVVAVGGNEMRAIRYDGTDVSPAWGAFPFAFGHPAAIGDVDNDGVTEIVTLKGSWFHVNRLATGPPIWARNFPGETFFCAPVLADMNGDGILEVAATTTNGRVYLLNHNGTDYSPDWPVDVSPGSSLTGVAFGQILGTSEPELVFAENSGDVHVLYWNGVEQTGYPQGLSGGYIYMPPMLSNVASSVASNVNVATSIVSAGVAQSWRNVPTNPTPGWPKNLPGRAETTFAAGDIDLDGRNEIVVLGVSYLTVLDVGIAQTSDPTRQWPMYGYDAQRTGCLACEEILTGVDDTPHTALTTSLKAHPNPFNPTTTIEYDVARAGKVSLEIFDVAGRRVATLIGEELRAVGRYSLTYSATGASGVYFARLRTVDGEVTRKIVLLK